jgi:hypothetical protein
LKFCLSLLAALLLPACSGCQSPQACTPGQSVACIGPGSCAGGQACTAAGNGFGICECGFPGSDGGIGGGGGGSNLPPPQVTLTSPESYQIGPAVNLQANVTGCTTVSQIEILDGTTSLQVFDNLASIPVTLALAPAALDALFKQRGIPVQLSLVAKARCDDARTHTSAPVAITFFPVESVTAPAAGNLAALPDSFVAEGGAAGTPTTFIGCLGTSSGVALARFDTAGSVVATNSTLPFACTSDSIISAKHPATGVRWLLQPDVGVFAFNAALNVTAFQKGGFREMGVGPDGDALIWDGKTGAANNFFRVAQTGGSAAPVWGAPVQGIMASPPLVIQNEVRVIVYRHILGMFSGQVVVMRFRYDTGAFISENELATINLTEFNVPIIPSAAFNPAGTRVFFASQQAGGSTPTSQVTACAIDTAMGCGSTGAAWISPVFDVPIVVAIPFPNGSLVAAFGGPKAYFLSAMTGQVANRGGAAIQPSGGRVTIAAQPGSGSDFYILNGAQSGFPNELVALDDPASSELWRLQIPGGATQATAMSLAFDDANTLWLRIGPNQVRTLTKAQYRQLRGAN